MSRLGQCPSLVGLTRLQKPPQAEPAPLPTGVVHARGSGGMRWLTLEPAPGTRRARCESTSCRFTPTDRRRSVDPLVLPSWPTLEPIQRHALERTRPDGIPLAGIRGARD